MSEEVLQIAERREGKGEKERYTHFNAEFQRTAKRDKKAFLSDQCKETEENNRMGMTRDDHNLLHNTGVNRIYLVESNGGATPRPRLGAAAARTNPTSKELWLRRRRRD